MANQNNQPNSTLQPIPSTSSSSNQRPLDPISQQRQNEVPAISPPPIQTQQFQNQSQIPSQPQRQLNLQQTSANISDQQQNIQPISAHPPNPPQHTPALEGMSLRYTYFSIIQISSLPKTFFSAQVNGNYHSHQTLIILSNEKKLFPL